MINELINKSLEEFEEEKVIIFNKGIPGFDDLKKFILLTIEENEFFYLLQSVEDKAIALTVVSPFSVDSSYEFRLEDSVANSLKIISENQVLILNTVTLNSDIKEITTNLAAPIIINIEDKIGEQIILNNDKYKIKTPIFKE